MYSQSAVSLHSAQGPVTLYMRTANKCHIRTYDWRVIEKREGMASRIREIGVSVGIENCYERESVCVCVCEGRGGMLCILYGLLEPR